MKPSTSFVAALLAPAGLAFGQAAPAQPQGAASTPATSAVVTRSGPRIRDVQLEVNLYATPPVGEPTERNGGQLLFLNPYSIAQARLCVPVLTRTTWTDTDFTKSTATIFVNSAPLKVDPATVFSTKPGTRQASAVFNLTPGNCNDIRVQVTYQVQQWDLTVDEGAAARITWPREWPAEVRSYLGAELGVRPDDPLIKSLAEGATSGGPRSVTPFVAAKRAVTAICGRYKSINQSTSEYGPAQSLRGIYFSPTNAGLATGRAAAVEFTADCVAALRAIEIPARIVYGVTLTDPRADGRDKRDNARFRFIGEFWLPEAGWIPFDPVRMKGQGAATRVSDAAIKGFANVDDLNGFIPLAYAAVPEGYQKADRYAIWGWNLVSGNVTEDYAASRIRLELTSRGNGKVPKMPAPLD